MARTANGVESRFTQDLVSPLSQILQTTQGTTTKHDVYGHERLYEQAGIARTWYAGDALGSVRQTLSDSGGAGTGVNYDPWGTPEGSATPSAFGFTGEWQDVGVGMVHLRARWYAPGQGRFTARDPFEGFATQPYSFNPYQYAYSDPVLYTDPSGQCVTEVGRRTCYPRGQSFLGQVAVAITREDYSLALHRVFNHDPELAAVWVPDHPLVDAELRKLILQRAPGCDPFATITFIKIEHAKWKIAHPAYGGWVEPALALGAGLLSLGDDKPVFGPDTGGGGGSVRGGGGRADSSWSAKHPQSLTPHQKHRLAKEAGNIPRSAQPTAQDVSRNGTRWWEYKDSNSNTKIVVEHTDGSVHVGRPKPQSPHKDEKGAEPKYYREPGTGHIGED